MPDIVYSKFVVPETGPGLWKNENLHKKLKQSTRLPLTLIQAPPGYGKTVNTADFYKNTGLNYCWYAVDKNNIDREFFWENLILAYNFTQEREFELNSKQLRESFSEIIKKFLNYLIKTENRDLYIIIDNFEILGNNRPILNSLAFFVNHISSGVHLLLLSRSKVRFPGLSTMVLKKKAQIINEDTLKFSWSLVKEKLQQVEGLAEEDMKNIYNKTAGWPLGIEYIYREYREYTGEKPEFSPETVFNKFADYFQREVIKGLLSGVGQLHDFILKTSILEKLRTEVCDRYLNIRDSEKILIKLQEMGIYIQQEEEAVYYYTPIFRNFLLNRAREKFDISKLKRDTARIYMELNRPLEAIYQFEQIGEYAKINELIQDNYSDWLKNGQEEILEECLHSLPTKIYDRFPDLWITKGDYLYFKGERKTALNYYLRARKEIKKEDQRYYNLLVKIILSSELLVLGNGYKYYLELAGYYKDLSDRRRNLVDVFSLSIKAFQGRAAEVKSGIKETTVKGPRKRYLQGLEKFVAGNIKKAENIFLVLKDEEEKVLATLAHIFWFLCRITGGNIYETLEYIWSKKPLPQNPSLLPIYNYFQVILHQLLPDPGNQIADYEQLIEKRKDFLPGLHRYFILFYREAYSGRSGKGVNYTRKLVHYTARNELTFPHAHTYFGLGIYYFQRKEYFRARKYFHKAEKLFADLKNQVMYLSTLIWMMLTLEREGELARAKEYLSKYATHQAGSSCAFLLKKKSFVGIRDYNIAAPFLLKAREQNIETDFINPILSELKMDKLTRHPGYSLHIQTLGDFRLYREQELLAEQDWKRKKSLDLCKLLLVNRGDLISSTRIISHLWPDKEPESARKNFYVVLSYLNSKLEPRREKREETFFVKKDGNNYGFVNQHGFIYDVDIFDFMVEKGQVSGDYHVKNNYYRLAVDLYHEDFMFNDIYKSWIQGERKRLQKTFLEISVELLAYYFQNEEYNKVINLAEKIHGIDEYIEKAYLYKMKAYNRLGKRSFALKTYQECREVFRKELNVEPVHYLKEYYESIT